MRYEFRLSTFPDIRLIHTTLMYNGHSMAQLNPRTLMELRDYLNDSMRVSASIISRSSKIISVLFTFMENQNT